MVGQGNYPSDRQMDMLDVYPLGRQMGTPSPPLPQPPWGPGSGPECYTGAGATGTSRQTGRGTGGGCWEHRKAGLLCRGTREETHPGSEGRNGAPHPQGDASLSQASPPCILAQRKAFYSHPKRLVLLPLCWPQS